MKRRSVCTQCNRLCVPAFSFEVDGATVHLCDKCKAESRDNFMLMLMAGDEKANRTLNTVKAAVMAATGKGADDAS